MPAAAVIPAPIAYIKIVAVKKLVVGFLVWRTWPATVTWLLPVCAYHPSRELFRPSLGWGRYLDLLL